MLIPASGRFQVAAERHVTGHDGKVRVSIVCELVEAWDAEDGHPMVVGSRVKEGLVRAEYRFGADDYWVVNPVDCDECEVCGEVTTIGEPDGSAG